MNWKKLSFSYKKVNKIARVNYSKDKWGELEMVGDDEIGVHVAATCINYGQAVFEGMKAYRGEDGLVRLFRWEENWKRLNRSGEALLIPPIEKEVFRDALFSVVRANEEFVPPGESGATLYIRPLVLGVGPGLGLAPASEYVLLIYCSPVGPYFCDGFKPVSFMIDRGYDRAAPLGTGRFKIGGNYAGALKSMKSAKDLGFASVIYLDAKEKRYIDECGPANFFGIKDGVYVTPLSDSILPSITNDSLMEIARLMGVGVERRRIPVEELGLFNEAGAVGTAAVITPIGRIVDLEKEKEYRYGDGEVGEVSRKLYEKLVGIQFGREFDESGWVSFVD